MPHEIVPLARALGPSFAVPEDATLAATMMVTALRAQFPRPIKGEDRRRYLAALERLPKGSTTKPRLKFGMPYGGGTHWRVIFTDGLADYPCSRRFVTQGQANDYASGFPDVLGGDQRAVNTRRAAAQPRRSGTTSPPGLPCIAAAIRAATRSAAATSAPTGRRM